MKTSTKILLILFVSSKTLFAAPAQTMFQLSEATIASVHNAFKTKNLSCVQLMSRYIARIKRYNLDLYRGAPINAFVSLNTNLIAEARALDKHYKKTGKLTGALHCIPIIVKDNIDTVDTPSTSGSLSLLGSQPNKNAFLVKQLKKAGALIIGKGAMDEFASGMFGISSKSGRVGNAYDPNLNPGGSSSGVGAAVSANFAMLGIGTDNSGSVRIPAAFNRIVGLRPSTGLISQSGIFPRGNMDGVAGPMARTMTDLAIVLSVLSDKVDPADPKTVAHTNRTQHYVNALNKNALRGKRIGVISTVAKYHPFATKNKRASALFNTTFEQFHRAGASLVTISLPYFNSNREDNLSGEVQDMNDYLASFPSTRENFKGICYSNRTRTFGNEKNCLAHINTVPTRQSKTFQSVLSRFKKNRDYVEAMMKEKKLDALLMPISKGVGPTYDLSLITSSDAPVSSNAGLPAITIITAGNTKNPTDFVSLELIGKQYDETTLIALAYSYTSLSKTRPEPQLSAGNRSRSFVSMTLPEMNNLFTLIGYRAFNHCLKNSKKQLISAVDFRTLVHDVLHEDNKTERLTRF